jgi:hypothetical protein
VRRRPAGAKRTMSRLSDRLNSVSTLAVWVAMVAVGVSANASAADVPLITTAGSTTGNNAGYTLGYDVNVGGNPIRLSALGVWDEGGDGLGAAHAVGIWNASGTLLGQATVPAGAAASEVDGYVFQNLASPVDLAANTTYIIGATFNSDDPVGATTTQQYANRNTFASPGVTFGFGRYHTGSSLGMPNITTTTLYTGPNALFSTVPEPASATLLLVPLSAAALRRRRSATA